MATVVFDCLVPRTESDGLTQRFTYTLSRLVEAGKLGDGEVVAVEESPALEQGVEETLRATYCEEHDGQDSEDAAVYRFNLRIEQPAGSVNGLVMFLSRLLTPAADLPRDPVALENERSFEVPARYPWTVQIAP